jgi:hypothetical protein
MKSGVACDFWSERYVVATTAEFVSIALLIAKQLEAPNVDFDKW